MGASLGFGSATNRLKITVADFKVPLEHSFKGTLARVTEVDVAKLYGLSFGIHPQRLSVPMPNGTVKNLTAKALSVTPQYQEGRVRVSIDVRNRGRLRHAGDPRLRAELRYQQHES